jgi:predicted cation transporter
VQSSVVLYQFGGCLRYPAGALYWVNIVSAILDNATLTAAEISPAMPIETIKDALAGFLIAGGMLIPGNIPNIICANKLSIKSREWAVFGVPLGMVIMVGFFIFLMLT